jgi:tRNA/rRNA methyltransferase
MRWTRKNLVTLLLDVRVVLVEPLYEANVGYVARTMKNFGVKDLRVVNPVYKLGEVSRMFAAHATDVIDKAVIQGSLEEALSDIDISVGTTARLGESDRNVLRSTCDLETAAERILSSNSRAAIVLGRDTTGLSNQELRLCDLIVSIPTSREYSTLNVSHAAAVIFYELFKANQKKRRLRRICPDKQMTHRLMVLFDELAECSATASHRRTLASRAFHNLLSRSLITRRETSLLIGVFRKNLRLINQLEKHKVN